MCWFASQGAAVAIPVGHSPDYDLIADFGERLVRVQVKTSSCWTGRRWTVSLTTRGGNQSWSGLVKRLDASRCDSLFVHVGDGRRWCIPAAELECTASLTLGGPKYAEFEVETGDPLPARVKAQSLAQS